MSATDNRFPPTAWGLVSKLLVDGLFGSLAIIGVTILASRVFGFPQDAFIDGSSTIGLTAVNAFVGILFMAGAIALIALGYVAGPFKLLFHFAAIVVIGLTAIGSLSAGFDRQSDSLGVPTEIADFVTGSALLSASIAATYVWIRARQFRGSFPPGESPPPQDEIRNNDPDLPPFTP